MTDKTRITSQKRKLEDTIMEMTNTGREHVALLETLREMIESNGTTTKNSLTITTTNQEQLSNITRLLNTINQQLQTLLAERVSMEILDTKLTALITEVQTIRNHQAAANTEQDLSVTQRVRLLIIMSEFKIFK